jgi:hypothetical protein
VLVYSTNGSAPNRSFLRISRHSRNPSMTGINMSEMTPSTGPDSSVASASAPLAASSTG